MFCALEDAVSLRRGSPPSSSPTSRAHLPPLEVPGTLRSSFELSDFVSASAAERVSAPGGVSLELGPVVVARFQGAVSRRTGRKSTLYYYCCGPTRGRGPEWTADVRCVSVAVTPAAQRGRRSTRRPREALRGRRHAATLGACAGLTGHMLPTARHVQARNPELADMHLPIRATAHHLPPWVVAAGGRRSGGTAMD